MSKALTKLITPKGELRWVTITGEGKENMSGKMQYVASIVLDPKNKAEDKAFVDKVDAFWQENKPAFMGKRKAKSLGYFLCDPLLDEAGDPILDDEDKPKYDPDGRVMVTFKTGVSFPDGSTKVVATYNSKAKKVALGNTKIGNGSIGFLSGAMDIYEVKAKDKSTDAGVTFYLNAIQINKLVEYSDDAGFAPSEDDEDEGGWTGDEGFEGTAAEDTPVVSSAKAGPRL